MTQYPPTASFARPRSRRRRGWSILLPFMAVLIAIVVVGDRVAAAYAAEELRTRLVAELDERGVEYRTADVTIGGFPFLAQVAQGQYDEIIIDMTDVRLPAEGGAGAVLPDLHVVATDVNADAAGVVQGTASVSAARVTGTAVVSFATLENLIDYSQYNLSDVEFTEEAGGLAVTGTAAVAGFEVPITATAEIFVADGQFQLRLRDAEAVSVPVPPAARAVLAELAERSITASLPALPFSLSLDQVRVQQDGLAITATGRDVPLVTATAA